MFPLLQLLSFCSPGPGLWSMLGSVQVYFNIPGGKEAVVALMLLCDM